MTNSNTNKIKSARAGLTLVELSVIIVVAISLIMLAFIGVRAWKSGSDRAACVMNVYKVQQAVRSYAASRAYYPGQDISNRINSDSLFDELVGPNKYVETAPVCPDEGSYLTAGNTIPRVGELYMTCSLSAEKAHMPESHNDW